MNRFIFTVLLLAASALTFKPALPALAQDPNLPQCSKAGDQCDFVRPDGTVLAGQGICSEAFECIEGPASGGNGTTTGSSCTKECQDNDRGLCIPNPLTDCDIVAFLNRVIDWIIYLSIFVTVIMIIVAGVMYVTAGGNTDRVKMASRTLVYALVGFAIVLLSKALALIIASALGANINPGDFK